MAPLRPRLPDAGDLSRLVVLITLVGIGGVMFPGFLSGTNLGTVLTAVAGLGILALGMTMVIITGEIDLSVAGTAVLSSIVGGMLLPTGSAVLVIGATLTTGLAVGLINGLLVARLGISSLITTLGTLGIATSLANIVSRGQAKYPEGMTEYLWFGRGNILGMPVPVALLIFCAMIALVLMRATVFGRQLYATGGNPEAAALSGIPTGRVKVAVFAICGFTAALVGLIESARLGYINPAAFPGLELRVLAIAVLGGAALAGGTGSVTGAVLATLIIGLINSLLNQAGVSLYLQQVVTGLVILAVVIPGRKWRRFVR